MTTDVPIIATNFEDRHVVKGWALYAEGTKAHDIDIGGTVNGPIDIYTFQGFLGGNGVLIREVISTPIWPEFPDPIYNDNHPSRAKCARPSARLAGGHKLSAETQETKQAITSIGNIPVACSLDMTEMTFFSGGFGLWKPDLLDTDLRLTMRNTYIPADHPDYARVQ